MTMADLTTSYMGLELRNPIIVSSSDLTRDEEGIKRCRDNGAAAVVLKSLFEEQFQVGEDSQARESTIYPEALDYLKSGALMEYAPQQVFQTIEKAKKQVDIPLIASINCQTPKLWPRFAQQLENAGADALELNIYFLPLDLETPGEDYEKSHLRILREVKDKVSIPVSIKLAHQFTTVPYVSQRLDRDGCDALVLFNWFMVPDIDTETLKTRNIKGQGIFHQCLKWMALLAGRLECDLSSSGGVQKADHVVKQILAGASAVQVCSLFYQKGLGEIENLLSGLEEWMKEHKYSSIQDFRGEVSFRKQQLSFKDMGQAKAYLRAQYLESYL